MIKTRKSKRPMKKKTSKRKRTSKKLSKQETKAIGSVLDNAEYNEQFDYNGGLGFYRANFAVENIQVGSQRWNRLGNKITPLGMKMTIDFNRQPTFWDPRGDTNFDAAMTHNINSQVVSYKIIVFQFKNQVQQTTTFSDLKLDTGILGSPWSNNYTLTGRSNNPFNRERYHIIFEKNFKIGNTYYSAPTSNSTNPEITLGPLRLTKSFYIPGKKMLPITYARDSPATTSGGIGIVTIGQYDRNDAVWSDLPNCFPKYECSIDSVLYYLP